MRILLGIIALSLVACGGSSAPPPKTEDAPEPVATHARRGPTGGPSVSQELGSIDERAVEKTFERLQPKLEVCHTQGRGRVEYLTGDVKVFLRVGQDGRMKYGYLESSTIGDRDTEKCLLDLFAATDWPKPEGGEAEVRKDFGWSAGSERQPASWSADKVTTALDAEAKKAIEQCKAGTTGTFRLTAYVEPGEVAESPAPKPGKKTAAKKEAEPTGKFKAIGVAAPNKDAASKADCLVDALRNVPLPSPGSYAAKVTFTL